MPRGSIPSIRAQSSDEEPKLKNDILSGSWAGGLTGDPAVIVRGNQDDRKTYIGGFLPQFGNDSAPAIGTLMKNDGSKAHTL